MMDFHEKVNIPSSTFTDSPTQHIPCFIYHHLIKSPSSLLNANHTIFCSRFENPQSRENPRWVASNWRSNSKIRTRRNGAGLWRRTCSRAEQRTPRCRRPDPSSAPCCSVNSSIPPTPSPSGSSNPTSCCRSPPPPPIAPSIGSRPIPISFSERISPVSFLRSSSFTLTNFSACFHQRRRFGWLGNSSVQVAVENGKILEISGEQKENKNRKWKSSHWWDHGFVRRIELPELADWRKSEAYIKNDGLLEIKIPKIPCDSATPPQPHN